MKLPICVFYKYVYCYFFFTKIYMASCSSCYNSCSEPMMKNLWSSRCCHTVAVVLLAMIHNGCWELYFSNIWRFIDLQLLHCAVHTDVIAMNVPEQWVVLFYIESCSVFWIIHMNSAYLSVPHAQIHLFYFPYDSINHYTEMRDDKKKDKCLSAMTKWSIIFFHWSREGLGNFFYRTLE